MKRMLIEEQDISYTNCKRWQRILAVPADADREDPILQAIAHEDAQDIIKNQGDQNAIDITLWKAMPRSELDGYLHDLSRPDQLTSRQDLAELVRLKQVIPFCSFEYAPGGIWAAAEKVETGDYTSHKWHRRDP